MVLLTFHSDLFSQQNIETLLAEIEKNNFALSALRQNIEAEKTGVKTGVYIPDPEIEFGALWSDPAVFGRRTDFSVKQSLDFPTAYFYRSQISELKRNQTELEYVMKRRDIFLQVRRICVDLVYLNAMKSELAKRSEHAGLIAGSYQKKFESGEVNALEYNKSQINRLHRIKEQESLEIERNDLLAELAGLNGGLSVDLKDSIMVFPDIGADFRQWYENAEKESPVIQWYGQEIAVSRKQEKLSAALRLPKLQIGYMSEKAAGQAYRGIVFGISVPLWEHKNTTKYSKLKTTALAAEELDVKNQLHNKLKALHAKSAHLQKMISDYRKQIVKYNHDHLLQKAFEKGQLSLSEYINELSFFYESVNRLLEMEKNLNHAVAEMYGLQ